MTLTVILLSLSDVRLDETRRTSLASLSDAALLCIAKSWLIWSPYDYLAQAHVHSARALHNLLALTNGKSAVSSEA